jgi:hypothetical protein
MDVEELHSRRNLIFMDGYDGAGYGVGGIGFDFSDPQWASLRKNLGYILSCVSRMSLAAMSPHSDLASSGYCLASPVTNSAEYLVYLPAGGSVMVDLSATLETLNVEWFNPEDGNILDNGTTTGGGERVFVSPFGNDAALYLYCAAGSSPTSTSKPDPNAIPAPSPSPIPDLRRRRFLPLIAY